LKILLKDFQVSAIDVLVERLRKAAREAAENDLQSVSLSAPTGSGKTVMATAAIESILQGDHGHLPQPEATFLWVTDQPALNEQTRRKMLAASSLLTEAHLIVVDPTFDQPALKPGCVHFLNIQKLGKDKSLVSRGDDRTYTIWETIRNTVEARPKAFFVVIDEAHRGMAETPRSRNEATTIIQKFIKGSPGEIPAVPMIVGISATPDRFNKLIEGTGRVSRPVVVKPEDVRESGLLKEVIKLYYPEENQPSDMTMLRAAARSLRTFTEDWRAYCRNHGEPLVEPILVVQVQDSNKTAKAAVSRTDIPEAILSIRAELGEMPNEAFAHAFQEGVELTVGDCQIRYVAPPDIQGDQAVRVVFFKTSLNSGWDCPRAEVMMSFRTASDATLIAQLVGRMVRTPLARRIDGNELLNTVPLYLPHYDEGGLQTVINHLVKPDAEAIGPVEVVRGQDAIKLDRVAGADDIFTAMAKLPSFTIPRTRKSSEVRRLMKLARLLSHDLDESAHDKAEKEIVDTLRAGHDRLKSSSEFKAVVEERGKLTVRAVNWQIGTDVANEDALVELDIAAENIDDLFQAAGRRLGDGLHEAWRRSRLKEDSSATERAKLEMFALCVDVTVMKAVEAAAQHLVQQWLKEHSSAIADLPESDRQDYDAVRRLAVDPELTPLHYPSTIDGRKAERTWRKHLYVNEKQVYPASFTSSWETKVLEAELAKSEVVAWLRNPDRKPWSLCVPYQVGGDWKPFYPDFIIVRVVGKKRVFDILDPHSIDLADAPAKAVGFARYAAQHAHHFGRISMIIIDGKNMRQLDLTDEVMRNKVKLVTNAEQLRQLFKSA
jgi:type III restriction enzyme